MKSNQTTYTEFLINRKKIYSNQIGWMITKYNYSLSCFKIQNKIKICKNIKRMINKGDTI